MSDNKLSLQEVVANYLRRNPGFLSDFPDVLEILQLSHASGIASSLIERQVDQLRKKNRDLTQQLNRLVRVASENEQLMSRLHQLTLELMAINNPNARRRPCSTAPLRNGAGRASASVCRCRG